MNTSTNSGNKALLSSGIHLNNQQHNLYMNIRPVLSPHPREHPSSTLVNSQSSSTANHHSIIAATISSSTHLSSSSTVVTKHRTAYKTHANQQLSHCVSPLKSSIAGHHLGSGGKSATRILGGGSGKATVGSKKPNTATAY